jgi:hypothetical protein
VAFSIKAWLDRFGSGGSFDQPTDTGATPDTPVDAASLRDMETRLSGYTDSREAAEVSARNTAIGSHATAEASARASAIAAAITAQGDLTTQAELDAHVNDTTAAHAASAIAVSPAVGGDATVQAVLTTHETRLDSAQSGSPVLYGAGAPGSGVGVNGDSYVDTTNHRLYGPKAAGAWPGTYEQLGAAGSLPSGTDGQIVGYVGTTPTALDVDAAGTAADVPFVPASGIAATDLQAAVVEAKTDSATSLAAHEADTTAIHGITDTSKLVVAGGDETVNTVATSGATQTIPAPTTASISYITLTANCTFTFPTAAVGRSFSLFLKQDGTGSRTVTWPGTVKWPGGTTPTLTTTAAKTDEFVFVCVDGTNWIGSVAGQNL